MHVCNHVLHRIVGECEGELTGLDLGEVEHVVDQAKEVLAVALDAVEHLAHLLGRLAIDVVEDELGVAEDGVERRAQFVAHVGEELRLVLARLGKLAALVLDFVEQPHVLDRDHGLVGEGLDQLDLLLGEHPHVLAGQGEDADGNAFAHQRNAQHRSITAELLRFRPGVFRILQHVGNVYRLRFQAVRPINVLRPGANGPACMYSS